MRNIQVLSHFENMLSNCKLLTVYQMIDLHFGYDTLKLVQIQLTDLYYIINKIMDENQSSVLKQIRIASKNSEEPNNTSNFLQNMPENNYQRMLCHNLLPFVEEVGTFPLRWVSCSKITIQPKECRQRYHIKNVFRALSFRANLFLNSALS